MGKKSGLILEVPGGAKRVLLHTCCAPCSSAIIEIMLRQGITPTVFYSNSNIFPLEEYLHRKDECTRYAQSLGLEIVDDDYGQEDCHHCGDDVNEEGGQDETETD
jgi:predicted adenine nucleotide alpha hydrolase (AANH) superfamily ATPase